MIHYLALGTGLRLAEVLGLNGGDVYALDGTPRSRVRIRCEIAKGGRGGEVFLARVGRPLSWRPRMATCQPGPS